MLLLGLIGIVGVALLAHSFELALIFLTVLVASLLMRTPLRKLLLGLQRGGQESRVVTIFWGTITLFLASIFTFSAFIYFNIQQISGINIPDILFIANYLIACISSLISFFILAFLRSKTGFPRWSRTLGVIFMVGLIIFNSVLFSLLSYQLAPPPLPYDFFDVVYHVNIDFEGKILTATEEYAIQPGSNHVSNYILIGIDDEWLSRSPGVSIGSLNPFEVKGPVGMLPGLLVTIHREIEPDTTGLGLLRRKLALSGWELRIRIKDLKKAKAWEEDTDGEAGISSLSLRTISRISGKLEVRLPKNSYLGSYPEGKLVKLLDRDQFILDFSNRLPNLELYYLAGLRFSLVQSILGNSSVPDITLKVIAFLFWPVVLLVLGATQRSLGDLLVKAIQRKPPPRRAGF